ncbi:hypothetical protein [Ligilactobacillus apodemi]|uniref:hypothetical protein n=1 Tax=Ligilactobacillus apodemi TaxID=307126 RepID=UPI00214BC509|nr:hypothetical protein [Ligilactobacillus apodemi]MCR1900668.1 hypothetical protein [Ligilactobacillus apodemi]
MSVAILSTLASLLAVVFVIALVMTLSQSDSNSKKIYSTNIEKISVDSNYNWQIEGTTKAPNGAKVIVMASNDDTNTASSVSKSTYAKVQDGKFKATVYLTELAPDEESEEANNKIKAKVVAVTGLDQTLTDDEMPKFVTAAAKETENITFKVSSSQADYSLSLNDSDEDSSSSYTYSYSYSYSSSSSSSSSSSTITASHDDSYYETGITYEQIARNPKTNMGKPVTFTGKVLQAIEDDGEVEGLRVAVDGDYDQVIYVQVGKTAVPDDSRILEDDLITLRGYACETITYEATSGASITIPAVYALKIDNQGTASSSYGYY